MAKSNEPVGLDMFPVSADEASELCIHHLKLAAVFFMNTPDDGGAALASEIERQIEVRSISGNKDQDAVAARKFLISLIDYHTEIKASNLDPDDSIVDRVLQLPK